MKCVDCGTDKDLRQLIGSPVEANGQPPLICKACYSKFVCNPPFEDLPRARRSDNLAPVSNIDVAEVATSFLSDAEKIALANRLVGSVLDAGTVLELRNLGMRATEKAFRFHNQSVDPDDLPFEGQVI